jgi:hypothetical protein
VTLKDDKKNFFLFSHLNPLASFEQHGFRHCQNYSEVVWIIEALSGQAEHGLLRDHGFNDLEQCYETF